jgi:hypothetical protein
MVMDDELKGCGRTLSRPYLRYYPAFSWKEWGKPRKTSVRIAGLHADIWTRDLPNTKKGTIFGKELTFRMLNTQRRVVAAGEWHITEHWTDESERILRDYQSVDVPDALRSIRTESSRLRNDAQCTNTVLWIWNDMYNNPTICCLRLWTGSL